MMEPHPFVAFLETLGEDRAALAQLRRGLGQPPGTVADMYRYVAPWIGPDTPRRAEDAHYVVAALYAMHPAPGATGDMGDHFRRAARAAPDATAIERRFTVLLSAHPDDLPFFLRQAVSFLRSKEVAVNWQQLFRDLTAWGHPERYVQRNWARSYWGPTDDRPTEPNHEEA